MRTLTLVGAIALLMVGTAMGAGQVAFTLQVGGDNNVDDWENGEFASFTGGQHDGYVLTQATDGTVLTWSVSAALATETNLNPPPATEPIGAVQGMANMVFDVKLLQPDGDPETAAKFFSTMNDSDMVNPGFGVKDPYEMAAFALGWNVDIAEFAGYAGDGSPDIAFAGPPPTGYGPPNAAGRLFDTAANGGAYMDRVQFPSTNTHGGGRMSGGAYFDDCDADGNRDFDDLFAPLAPEVDTDADGIIDDCETPASNVTNAPAGTLLGMGIGYSQLSWTGAPPYVSSMGVGIAFGGLIPDWTTGSGGSPAYVNMGTGPVAEGQIDMAGLPSGTYTLQLVAPLAGQNVIKAAYDPIMAPGGSFAEQVGSVVYVDAENEVADSLTFVWIPVVTEVPAKPIAWKSIRLHGANEYAIDLDSADANLPTSEPRNNGTNPKLAIVFAKADGTTPADLTDPNVGYTAGQVAITFAGADTDGLTYTESFATTNGPNDTLVLTLSGIVDRSCYKFDVSGSVALVPGADATCSVVNIVGDSNNSRTVTVSDVAQVRTSNNQAVFPSNIRRDFNLSDSITVSDVALARTKNNSNPIPCP